MRLLLFATAVLASLPSALGVPKKKVKDKGRLISRPVGYYPEVYPKLEYKFVCDRLDQLASEANFLHDLVKVLHSGDRGQSWDPVRKTIYQLEYRIDQFDTDIDNSDVSKRWRCSQESKISDCYIRYANALIRALNKIADKISSVDRKTYKYMVTGINSLRDADYAFVNELGRRMHCEEYLAKIFKKQGAMDGSTPGSIRQAFSKFASTPIITGEDFGLHPEKIDDGRDRAIEVGDEEEEETRENRPSLHYYQPPPPPYYPSPSPHHYVPPSHPHGPPPHHYSLPPHPHGPHSHHDSLPPRPYGPSLYSDGSPPHHDAPARYTDDPTPGMTPIRIPTPNYSPGHHDEPGSEGHHGPGRGSPAYHDEPGSPGPYGSEHPYSPGHDGTERGSPGPHGPDSYGPRPYPPEPSPEGPLPSYIPLYRAGP